MKLTNKLRTFAIAAPLAFSALAVAPAAQAEVSANVALTSNYIFRGISQTLDDGAIQGGFDYSHESGFYVGTWASSIDFGTAASLETDLYAGFGGEVADGLGYDISVIRYFYDDQTDDTSEATLNLSYKMFSATFAYSPDWYASGNSAWYLKGAVDMEVTDGVNLGAWVGKSDGDAFSGTDYLDYGVSVATTVSDIEFKFAVTDTDLSSGSDADPKFALTISKSM